MALPASSGFQPRGCQAIVQQIVAKCLSFLWCSVGKRSFWNWTCSQLVYWRHNWQMARKISCGNDVQSVSDLTSIGCFWNQILISKNKPEIIPTFQCVGICFDCHYFVLLFAFIPNIHCFPFFARNCDGFRIVVFFIVTIYLIYLPFFASPVQVYEQCVKSIHAHPRSKSFLHWFRSINRVFNANGSNFAQLIELS